MNIPMYKYHYEQSEAGPGVHGQPKKSGTHLLLFFFRANRLVGLPVGGVSDKVSQDRSASLDISLIFILLLLSGQFPTWIA